MSEEQQPTQPAADIPEEEQENEPGEQKCDVVFMEEEEIDEEEEEAQYEDASAHSFTEHEDAVYSVAFCKKPLPNGTIVFASGGGDDQAIMYHLIDKEEPKTFHLKGHTESINSLAFSADGTLLVTSDLNGNSIVWDTTDGHEISRLTGPTEGIEWVNWHPSLPAVLCGDSAGMIWLFSAKIGKCVKVYSSHVGPVTCGGFRSDGSEIWSAGEDMHLRIWAPKSGQATTTLSGLQWHHEPIITGCNNRNGAIIATGDMSGIVKLMRCDTGKIIGQLDTGENSVEKVEFSYDDNYIAVASMGGAVTIWSPNDLKNRHALQHPGGVTSLAWHPKRPYVISACVDGAVRVWDARSGELMSEMHGHADVITGLDVYFDGNVLLIITSSEDTSVKLWVFDEKNPIKPVLLQKPANDDDNDVDEKAQAEGEKA
ncbi:WD repeat protein [Tritrichomonas foetus]|uniref:WD repeat protein n=1 Tax=Tritrichomonas foetus TaxID=1144522 RepID=A0A1J4JQ56_9EUKA|nr:WD repeat protein [Tritrichomonas foetus]|eukprot:OHS99364.1 WD repeat protein [Tritrichomonas foetus]